MANDFKNTDLVTKYMVKEFINALQLVAKMDRQVDETSVFAGKVGAQVRIRRPVMFKATEGAKITAGQLSDIEEATVLFTLNRREKVAFAISTQDLTLEIEDARERYIKPAAIELAQLVESAAADEYKNIFNFVGTPGTKPGNFLAVATAKAKLSNLGVPMDAEISAFYDPDASVTLSDSLKGVFPQSIAKKAIERAAIGMYGGMQLYENQSLKLHVPGLLTGTPEVNGVDQNTQYSANKDTGTQTIITDGWIANQTPIGRKGDVITFALVNSVNRRSREDTGSLAQFVLAADVNSDGGGNATLVISPPIIIDGPYQTVTVAPANNAAIGIVSSLTPGDGLLHRQNIAFHKNAITFASVPLDLPEDGASAARQTFMGVSIRAVRQYGIGDDETIYRFDILFGFKTQNPGFAVRTTS